MSIFYDLQQRMLEIQSAEEARRNLPRFGALAARAYQAEAKNHTDGFELSWCQPKLTFSPSAHEPPIPVSSSTQERLWWMTWQQIVCHLATTATDKLPGPARFGDPDLHKESLAPGVDLVTAEYPYTADQWKQGVRDHAAACGLLADWIKPLSKNEHSVRTRIMELRAKGTPIEKITRDGLCSSLNISAGTLSKTNAWKALAEEKRKARLPQTPGEQVLAAAKRRDWDTVARIQTQEERRHL